MYSRYHTHSSANRDLYVSEINGVEGRKKVLLIDWELRKHKNYEIEIYL